ncbi:hypothetical protein GGR56DRAFT_678096 [Xylariaceae sp. FL0804]|nr:hypothetical protein GGR56DRAFT_678096 [Xylariaceae sp. FL0804]
MCHGHPHFHPCKHTSVKWLYCPEAAFDLDTGYETPCSNAIYSAPQPTNVDCPLKNCNFKPLRGSWNCCVCGNGPNTQGWCTVVRHGMDWNPFTGRVEDMDMPCGHGCCSQCSRTSASRAASPETSFAEVRKGKGTRKAHGSSRSLAPKRGATTTYDLGGGTFSTIVEEDEQAAAARSSKPTTGTRGARKSSHDANGDCPAKRAKLSSSRKKHQKARAHK